MTRGVIIQVVPSHRGPKYADQAVTGRYRSAVGEEVIGAQGRSYGFVEHSGDKLVVADVERQFRFTTHEDMK